MSVISKCGVVTSRRAWAALLQLLALLPTQFSSWEVSSLKFVQKQTRGGEMLCLLRASLRASPVRHLQAWERSSGVPFLVSSAIEGKKREVGAWAARGLDAIGVRMLATLSIRSPHPFSEIPCQHGWTRCGTNETSCRVKESTIVSVLAHWLSTHDPT